MLRLNASFTHAETKRKGKRRKKERKNQNRRMKRNKEKKEACVRSFDFVAAGFCAQKWKMDQSDAAMK